MNRHERRRIVAQVKAHLPKKRLIKPNQDPGDMPPARTDGRPLYYDVSPDEKLQCLQCIQEGKTVEYSLNEGFMNDPANSPLKDGATYTICRGHLPENAVIFNPKDFTCRNKAGDNVWKEDDL